MKKAKKLLALFMSALMVFSMFSGLEITSFAWFWDDEPTLDIVSLEVEPGTVIENYNGYWDLKWGEDLMEIEFYYYFLDELDYTVTLSDGTVLESFYGYVEYDDVLYSLDSVDSQYANPLTLGANEVTVSLEGFETTAIVEVVETPVSAVSIDTVYLVENSDGFWDTTYDEAEFFCYNMPYFNYTVTLNDGTVLESDEIGSFMYNGREHYMAECFDQYETPLTPGENYVTVDVLGFEATAIVEIIETPVVAMEIEPIIVVKETKGNWDIEYDDDWNETEYFCYDLFFTDYTVTLNDGTVLESDYGYITYGGMEYYIEKNFSQSEEPLNVGINEIPVSILGFNTTICSKLLEKSS